MNYTEICENEYSTFHELANAYYREGEDADTPQETIDSFIHMLFDKVMCREICGCFAKDGQKYVGFALWAIDHEDFAFHEMSDFGTILEIGLIPSYRSRGLGKQLLGHIEENLRKSGTTQCYVSAYGPAQRFWMSCGYAENGATASNGLPIMTKVIF